MELFCVSKNDTSIPIFTGPFEDYTSLIWTERYLEPGDFELTSDNPGAVWNRFFLGDLVTIRESGEVAMVESKNIKTNSDGSKSVVIKGRTVDAFLNERAIPGRGGKQYKMNQPYDNAEAAAVLIWNAICNNTSRDVTLKTIVTNKYTVDYIPNTRVALRIRSNLPSGNRYLNPGQVLPEVQKFLRAKELGLKTMRGGWDETITNISVSTSSDNATRGNISRTTVVNTNDLVFQIYEGYDRSRTNTDGNTPVIFAVEADHFDEPETLESIEGYKTWAHVDSENGDVGSTRNNTQFNYSSWDRRVLYVDAGGPASDEVAQEFVDNLDDVGKAALSEHRLSKMFDGKLSSTTPYIYGYDYFLGDIVTVASEDNTLIRPMRVQEYIRTDDDTGSRGLPSLMELDEL